MSTSNYSIPIFISSTVYNLLDLRAELCTYLKYLGYEPKLSSESGFPDQTPRLSPWESCLPVLERSFIMTLIIDNKYGQKLNWDNYLGLSEVNEPISPTHGEYRYAKSIQKKLLVFVRREIVTYYQSYRELKGKGYTESEIRIKMEEVLPKRIDYDVFPFLNEVKTKKPIPWIVEFDDVVQIKEEIQKKLNNELAEVFLLKEQHEDTLIKGLNEVMNGMSQEARINLISKLNIKSDLVDKIKLLEENISALEKEKSQIVEDVSREKTVLESKISSLNSALIRLKDESDNYRLIVSGSSNRLEYTNLIEKHCDRCGCLGEYDCENTGLGSVFMCGKCSGYFCENCKSLHTCNLLYPQAPTFATVDLD